MTELGAKTLMLSILDNLGVQRGDTIMLGIDMGKIPLPTYQVDLNREAFRKREEQWCRYIMEVLLERLGNEGTLLVPSYSYSCSKPNSKFDSLLSPSEVGPFTEFFRKQSGVVRSLHPVFSIAGKGYNAEKILEDTGFSAFGMGSPFSKFKTFRVKFLCLGVAIKNAITYIHHMEQYNGGAHRFNKIFESEVYHNGVKIEGDWSAYIGFRGLNYRSDISSLQQGLQNDGSLIECEWEGNINQIAHIDDVDRVGYNLLKKNPYTFVNRKISLHFDDSILPEGQEDGICNIIIVDTETKQNIF